MRDSTIVKLAAITALTTILIVDFLTMKIDSTLVASISAIIGGIAGYQFGVQQSKRERK